MAYITFYTKLGCLAAGKQLRLLRESGHRIDVQDLLTQPWRASELAKYFSGLPVAERFNMNAPRVKSGEINPAALDADAALELMLEDPLLIRRPLMVVGNRRVCGFDPGLLQDWIGLSPAGNLATANNRNLESCQHA
jgi:nitrogenase-associated protein